MTKETNSKKKGAFYEDLIKVQSEIQTLYKDENNPFFKSKYVPLANILKEVKPVLNNNNFLLVQRPTLTDENKEILITQLIHSSGDSIECIAPLKVEDRDRNNPQKYGSAITYMRRYTLTSLLALEEEDDDGNTASQGGGSYPYLKNVAKAADEEMNHLKSIKKADDEKKKQSAEDYFKKIKKQVEDCGSVEEIDSILEKEDSSIQRLKSSYKTIYNRLMDSVKDMKVIIDPEENE